MDTLHCDVRIVRTPYEANGIQLYRLEDDNSEDSSVPYQHFAAASNVQSSAAAIGTRGVRALLASRPSQTPAEASRASPTETGTTREALRILTKHQKGQVLVWDCDTHHLIGACSHGEYTSVMQCILTPRHLFVCVECVAGKDALEEDQAIYVWDPVTLQRLHVLRAHKGRVTVIAVDKEHPGVVVSAGIDRQILVWDLNETVAKPVLVIPTASLRSVTGMTVKAGHVIATGNDAAIGVWNLVTGRPVAFTPSDVNSSTTAFRVVTASRDNGSATSSATGNRSAGRRSHSITGDAAAGVKLSVYTGTSDGYLREWSLFTVTPSAGSGRDRRRLSCTPSTPNAPPMPNGEDAGKEEVAMVVETTGCVDLQWQNKYHRCGIANIIVDGDVIATAGVYDGAFLYHRGLGLHRMLSKNMEGGCRAMVLDAANKRVLVGSDCGSLRAFNYAEFAARSSRDVVSLWTCTPHLSAVTGIFLEVGMGNVWERVLTCGADGAITIFDASANTASTRSINDSSSSSFVPVQEAINGAIPLPLAGGRCCDVEGVSVAENGTVVVAYPTKDEKNVALCARMPGGSSHHKGSDVCVNGVPLGLLLPLPGTSSAADSKASAKVSLVRALHWHSESKQLLVGLSSGVVRAYTITSPSEAAPSPTWSCAQTWSFPSSAVFGFSDAGGSDRGDNNFPGSYVCVSLMSAGNQGRQTSSFALLDVTKNKPVAPLQSFTALSTSPITHTVVVRDPSTEALLIIAGSAEGTVMTCPLIKQRDCSMQITPGVTIASGGFLSSFSSSGGPILANARSFFILVSVEESSHTFTLAAVKGPLIRRVCCGMDGQVVKELKAVEVGVGNFSLCLIQQAGIEIAVIRSGSAKVDLFDSNGVAVCRVSYQGFVKPLPKTQETRRKRVTTYAPQGGTQEAPVGLTSSPCCSIAVQRDRRYIVIGYENGLLQIVDTTYRYVYARVWTTKLPAAVTQLWAIGDTVFASQLGDGVVMAQELRRRALMDSEMAK